MPRWTFRGVLSAWALGLVAAAIAATAAVSYAQVVRLAREEARARTERALERGLAALERGLPSTAFETGREVELVVRGRAEIERSFADPRIPLWRAALEGDRASRVFAGDTGAVAVAPLPTGPAAGLLEARIRGRQVLAPARRLATRLLLAAALVAGAAALAAALLARRLGRPLSALARAAERMGGGDLGHAVEDPGGAETGALAATLEQMRRRLGATQSELERRRAEVEAVVSGIAEGVIAVDRDRRIRFASAPAAALLGLGPEALLGNFCGDVLRPELEDGERPCEQSCPILHARFRGPARAVERIGADGARRAVVVSSSPPAEGLQVLILAEETPVEAARRARDAAVAGLAHELQTPLAAQRASLELLRDRLAASDRPALELVLALEAGTARVRRLVDNLLESVRIESGQLAIRRVEVDLEEAVEEAVAMTRPLLDRRRQPLVLALPHPLPGTTGDPQRIVQVLVNLLANASKFGPEDTEVRLGATVAAGGVELWVEDRGPGFVAGAQPARPRRFGRGAEEPPQEGSGLGLWICRSILERHGGGLRVERAAGTTRVVASFAAGSAA